MTTKIHISMQHQEENTLSLGKQVQTFTGNAVKNIGEISNKVNQTAKHLSSEINEKVHNATQLITGGLGGYIVIRQSEEDGHPEEILIMNAPSVDDATNVIRFNQNGIGFSTTGIDGPYSNAWTIDGNLVADFITSGTMSADRINGGTINGQTINGGTITGTIINGSTINGSTINSQGSGHNVSISGGNLTVNNDAYNFLNVHQQDGTFAIGGKTFATYNGSVYYGDYETIYIGKAAQEAGAGSDKRLKKKIKTLDYELSKNIVLNTRPVQFLYKDGKNEHGTRYGVIAQELRDVLDKNNVGEANIEYVRHDGYHTVEYKEFIAHLINVAQSQQSEIDELKQQLKKEDK